MTYKIVFYKITEYESTHYPNSVKIITEAFKYFLKRRQKYFPITIILLYSRIFFLFNKLKSSGLFNAKNSLAIKTQISHKQIVYTKDIK